MQKKKKKQLRAERGRKEGVELTFPIFSMEESEVIWGKDSARNQTQMRHMRENDSAPGDVCERRVPWYWGKLKNERGGRERERERKN